MTSTLQMELKEVHSDFEALIMSVRMLSSSAQDLDSIPKAGKTRINRKGLGFIDKSQQGVIRGCSNTVFIGDKGDQDKKK